MKKNIIIHETKNYAIFKRLKGNRDVKCVEKIVKSINRIGYITNPIIVNEKMEIIDGQNRVEALERLNMPVQYYVIEGADIETARSLNLGRTNWKPIDYVKSYAEDGNKSYQFLLLLIQHNNGYALQEVYGIATGSIMTSGWGAKRIEDGEFKLSEKEFQKAQELIGYMEQLREAIKNMKGSRRALITTIAWCMRVEGCDIKRLIKVLQNKYPLIRPVVDTEYLLYDITKIYNEGLKTKAKKIDFDVLYRNSK